MKIRFFYFLSIVLLLADSSWAQGPNAASNASSNPLVAPEPPAIQEGFIAGGRTTSMTCDDVLQSNSYAEISRYVLNSLQLIANLRVDSADIETIEPELHFDSGLSGHSFRVRVSGRQYVLKLFKAAPRTLNGEQSLAIGIQQLIASWGFAPKIKAVMIGEDVTQWLDTHYSELNSIAIGREQAIEWQKAGTAKDRFQPFGLLMEYFEGMSAKEPGQGQLKAPLRLSQQQYEQTYEQAAMLGQLMFSAGIQPSDPDFLISREGIIKLIDLADYQLFHIEWPLPHQSDFRLYRPAGVNGPALVITRDQQFTVRIKSPTVHLTFVQMLKHLRREGFIEVVD